MPKMTHIAVGATVMTMLLGTSAWPEVSAPRADQVVFIVDPPGTSVTIAGSTLAHLGNVYFQTGDDYVSDKKLYEPGDSTVYLSLYNPQIGGATLAVKAQDIYSGKDLWQKMSIYFSDPSRVENTQQLTLSVASALFSLGGVVHGAFTGNVTEIAVTGLTGTFSGINAAAVAKAVNDSRKVYQFDRQYYFNLTQVPPSQLYYSRPAQTPAPILVTPKPTPTAPASVKSAAPATPVPTPVKSSAPMTPTPTAMPTPAPTVSPTVKPTPRFTATPLMIAPKPSPSATAKPQH